MNRITRITQLNDELRKARGLNIGKNKVFATTGVSSKGQNFLISAITAMVEFDAFTADNDPTGERDFGKVVVSGQDIFWKIDYYDDTCRGASPDPSDPEVTVRVLTIMLSEEY